MLRIAAAGFAGFVAENGARVACLKACGAGGGVADDARSAAGRAAGPAGLCRRGGRCPHRAAIARGRILARFQSLTVSTRSLPGSRLSLRSRRCSCARPDAPARCRRMFVLSIVADIATTAIKLGFPLVAPAAAQSALWTGSIATDAIYALAVVWWVGAMVCVVGSLEWQSPQARPRLIGRVVALWVALFVANALVPHAPVFLPPNFDAAQRQLVGSSLRAPPGTRRRGARTSRGSKKHSRRCSRPRSPALAPQRKGVTDIYALGIAGWGDQDVFVKELDGGLESIASVLPIKDRTIRLDQSSRHGRQLFRSPICRIFRPPCMPSATSWTRTKTFSSLFMTSHGEQDRLCAGIAGAARPS